jgi:hypothetical protein
MQILALLPPLYMTSSGRTPKKTATSYTTTLKTAEDGKGYVTSTTACYVSSLRTKKTKKTLGGHPAACIKICLTMKSGCFTLYWIPISL